MIMQMHHQRHQRISQPNININNKYPTDIKLLDELCYILPNVSFNNDQNMASIIAASVKYNGGVTKAASRNPKIKVCIWLM